jgi:hypothetical protein
MSNALTGAVADPGVDPRTTYLKREVAASEHAAGGGASPDAVRVVARHGIWTISVAGDFVGDYLDEETALAAAAQVRLGGRDGNAADPWQRRGDDAHG